MTSFPTPDDVLRLRIEAVAARVREFLVARFTDDGEIEMELGAGVAESDARVLDAVANHFRASGWVVRIEEAPKTLRAGRFFTLRFSRAANGG